MWNVIDETALKISNIPKHAGCCKRPSYVNPTEKNGKSSNAFFTNGMYDFPAKPNVKHAIDLRNEQNRTLTIALFALSLKIAALKVIASSAQSRYPPPLAPFAVQCKNAGRQFE